jgi:hypothetical protein
MYGFIMSVHYYFKFRKYCANESSSLSRVNRHALGAWLPYFLPFAEELGDSFQGILYRFMAESLELGKWFSTVKLSREQQELLVHYLPNYNNPEVWVRLSSLDLFNLQHLLAQLTFYGNEDRLSPFKLAEFLENCPRGVENLRFRFYHSSPSLELRKRISKKVSGLWLIERLMVLQGDKVPPKYRRMAVPNKEPYLLSQWSSQGTYEKVCLLDAPDSL